MRQYLRSPMVSITLSLIAIRCTSNTTAPSDTLPPTGTGHSDHTSSDHAEGEARDSGAGGTDLDAGSFDDVQSTTDHAAVSLETGADADGGSLLTEANPSTGTATATQQDAASSNSEETEAPVLFAGSSDGVVAQQPFRTAGGVSFVHVDPSRTATGIGIELSNLSDYCSKVRAVRADGVATANTRVVSLVVVNLDDASPPIGTFEVDYQPNAGTLESTTGIHAGAFFGANDDMCASVGNIDAVSGTIEVLHVSERSIKGAFSLVFPDEEMVTGTFDAPRCDDVLEVPASDNRTCVE